MKKRWICIVLLLLFLCGCSADVLPVGLNMEQGQAGETGDGQGEEGVQMHPKTMSLVYFDGESLNPLNTQSTTNFALKYLYCDPLIALDENQQPMPGLVHTWEIEQNVVTLSLTEGVYFHDGTPFAARHVEENINYVMQTVTSPYYALREKIATVRARNERTVEIVLKEADYGFFALLNMPIVKIPGGDSLPIGTGRYFFEQEDGQLLLKQNEAWYGNQLGLISQIILKSYPDREAVSFAFSSGDIDLLHTAAILPDQQGFYGSAREQYYINTNVTFLSVNMENEILSTQVRSGLNQLVDRARLTNARITPVFTPLYPGWWALPRQTEQTAYITQTQREQMLQELGFVDLNGDGIFDKPDGTSLDALVLLANGDNEEKSETALRIADQLRTMGFPIEIVTPSFEEYAQRLTHGQFDLALCEIKLDSSMNVAPLVLADGQINYGGYAPLTLVPEMEAMQRASSQEAYQQAAASLYDMLLKEVPVISLFYKTEAVLVQENIGWDIQPTANDVFINIEKW